MRKNIGIGWFMAAMLVVTLLAVVEPALAAPNIKEKGTLEAVEDNGRSVIIVMRGAAIDKVERENRGTYQVSPYAIIINGFGKKAALDTFSLPAKIEFEVEYTAQGPIIKKIRELPQ
jgi:hypothetical protein